MQIKEMSFQVISEGFKVIYFIHLGKLLEIPMFRFLKIITRYKRMGYYFNIMRQTACLVYNPIMVDSYAFLIMKTYLYNFDPFKPHFYIVKLVFTGVYSIFLISAQKHRLWVLVRTASLRRF